MKKFKTKAATVVLRPDDIIEYTNNKEWDEPETKELAHEIMQMIKELVDGKPRGFLVEVPTSYP